MKVGHIIDRACEGVRRLSWRDALHISLAGGTGFMVGWSRALSVGIANPALAGLAVAASLAAAFFFAAASRSFLHSSYSPRENAAIHCIRNCSITLIVATAPLALFALGALTPLWLGISLGVLGVVILAELFRVV